MYLGKQLKYDIDNITKIVNIINNEVISLTSSHTRNNIIFNVNHTVWNNVVNNVRHNIKLNLITL